LKSNLTLNEICEAIVDSEHNTAPTLKQGIPYVRTPNIQNGRIDLRNSKKVSEEIYKKWIKRLEPREDDIILTREAPVGEVAIIPPNQRLCLGQRTVLIRPNKKLVFPRYLLYLFLTNEMQNKLSSQSDGTILSHLNMADIRKLEIFFLPDLHRQQLISEKLGVLDQKIDIIHNINSILEIILETIFKSWFEDSDTYSTKEWRLVKLSEHIDSIKGCSYKSEDLKESNCALITLKSVNRHGGYNEDGLKSFSGKYKPEQIIEPGDVVVAHTDLTQNADVLGKPAIVRKSKSYDVLVASLDLSIIKLKQNYFTKNFLYFLLKSEDFQNHAFGYSNGTTVLHLDKKAVLEYEFPLPPKNLILKFDTLANKIINLINKNVLEESILVKARNILLPKFFSGEHF